MADQGVIYRNQKIIVEIKNIHRQKYNNFEGYGNITLQSPGDVVK